MAIFTNNVKYDINKLELEREMINLDWIQLIGSVGFPIVACICMALYVRESTNANREDLKMLNEQHTREMDAFKDEITQALNNNTIAITKLCEKLERGEVIK